MSSQDFIQVTTVVYKLYSLYIRSNILDGIASDNKPVMGTGLITSQTLVYDIL